MNNFNSEKKITKINGIENGNSSNNINNYSSKKMNYINQFDINNPQNNYKKFNNIKNGVEVKKVNRNKYISMTLKNNQDMNYIFNSKILKISHGMNNNNNHNYSYKQMNNHLLHNFKNKTEEKHLILLRIDDLLMKRISIIIKKIQMKTI